MIITSQQLRELEGKATQDPLDDDGEYFSEHRFDDLTQCYHGDTGHYQNRHDGKLIAALWNNREALLTALELQERLDKPETVEVLARAIMLNRENGGCIVKDWQREAVDNSHVSQALNQAQAAINALKGGAQ